jgi:hypothetical protein
MAKFRAGLQNWLALAFTIGSILGSFISAYSSNVFGTAQGVHPYNAFLGGFVMVFGARIGFFNIFFFRLALNKFFQVQQINLKLVDVRVGMV